MGGRRVGGNYAAALDSSVALARHAVSDRQGIDRGL